MRKSILLSLLICSIVGWSQQNTYFRILHHWDGQTLSYGTSAPSGTGEDVTLSRLEYYISGIEIKHDGGQTIDLDTLYILADAQTTTEVFLGNLPIQTLESIAYSIGVDTNSNHLDPASYPMTHPLAPKSPSMHWGWAAGYRFVALEGIVGISKDPMEMHALGNDNYFNQEISTSGEVVNGDLIIQIDAEYMESLKSMPLNGGFIFHGIDGIATTFLEDFRDSVFTPTSHPVYGIGIGVEEEFQNDFTIQPNPAVAGRTTLMFNEPSTVSIQIIDLAGREVYHNEAKGATQVPLTFSNPGMYLVRIVKNGTSTTQRLIVQ